jgi:hypothetical protein
MKLDRCNENLHYNQATPYLTVIITLQLNYSGNFIQTLRE